MKKIMLTVIVMTLLITAFSAYPQYTGLNDPAYITNVNGNVNINNKTVDVKIYQWISGNFFSRSIWGSARNATIGGQPITSYILIDKPGLITNQFLGVLAFFSNGRVDIDITLAPNLVVSGKTNITSRITALSAVNAITTDLQTKISNLAVNSDINDAKLNSVQNGESNPVTYSYSGSTLTIGNVFGNSIYNGSLTGPEFGLFADFNIALNQEPGQDFIIGLDMVIKPKLIF